MFIFCCCWAGLYKVFNKKTSDLTPQANSSSRNRLTVLEAHLSKPVVSTNLHFILGNQTKQCELRCADDPVLCPGACFPLGSRQSWGPRLSERQTHRASRTEGPRVRLPPLLHRTPANLPGAVWLANADLLLVPCTWHRCHTPPRRFKALA